MVTTIERLIRQERDGSLYDGTITLGAVEFAFDIRFGVLIPDLCKHPPVATVADARKIFQLTIHKGGVAIELSDDEFLLFVRLVSEFAEELYWNDQTRDVNAGLLSDALRHWSGVKIQPSLHRKETVDLPEEVCNLLRSNKFGCRF